MGMKKRVIEGFRPGFVGKTRGMLEDKSTSINKMNEGFKSTESSSWGIKIHNDVVL